MKIVCASTTIMNLLYNSYIIACATIFLIQSIEAVTTLPSIEIAQNTTNENGQNDPIYGENRDGIPYQLCSIPKGTYYIIHASPNAQNFHQEGRYLGYKSSNKNALYLRPYLRTPWKVVPTSTLNGFTLYNKLPGFNTGSFVHVDDRQVFITKHYLPTEFRAYCLYNSTLYIHIKIANEDKKWLSNQVERGSISYYPRTVWELEKVK